MKVQIHDDGTLYIDLSLSDCQTVNRVIMSDAAEDADNKVTFTKRDVLEKLVSIYSANLEADLQTAIADIKELAAVPTA